MCCTPSPSKRWRTASVRPPVMMATSNPFRTGQLYGIAVFDVDRAARFAAGVQGMVSADSTPSTSNASLLSGRGHNRFYSCWADGDWVCDVANWCMCRLSSRYISFSSGSSRRSMCFCMTFFVVAHGRSRLCLGRRQGLYLGRCLSDERDAGPRKAVVAGPAGRRLWRRDGW